MNCELYGAECRLSPDPPKGNKRPRRAKGSSDQIHRVSGNGPPENRPSDPTRDIPPPAVAEDGCHADMGESRGSVNITPSPHVLQTEPSGVYPSLSGAGFSAIQMAISDGGIGLTDELWELDGFVASCNLPDENAAAEQLFAPHPSQKTVDHSDHRSPRSVNKPRSSRLYGVDSLASPATSNSGDMSPGIFLGKGRGNSQFLGSFIPALSWQRLTLLAGFTSTAATIALCIRQATDRHHRLADSESLRFIMDSSPMCDEISCAELDDHPQLQALSSTVAARCINGGLSRADVNSSLTQGGTSIL